MRLRPDRFLNFVWAWAVERVPEDKMEQWRFEMEAPLPGEVVREAKPQDWENDGDTFMAAMTAMQGIKK